MKFSSADCRWIGEREPGGWMWDHGLPWGSFFWGEVEIGGWDGRSLWILMPYVPRYDGHPWHCLPVALKGAAQPDPERRACWEWDGNEKRPTLHPSIACGEAEDRDWHGFLRAGRLKACG